MDARHVAVGVGSVTLAVLGLGAAVLFGEGSFVPTPRDKPAITTVHSERPLAAYPAALPGVADPTPIFPAPAEPPPEAALAPAPKEPPLIEQAPQAEQPPPPAEQASPVGPSAPRLEAAAPQDSSSSEQAQSSAVRPPHRSVHGRHRLADAEPSVDQAPPPVAQVQPPFEPVQPPPKPRPPVVDHRYDGVLTVAEIGRMKRELRLSPDQTPYWPQIASLLREVGRRQMAQVDAGQRPSFDLPGDLSSRLYSAAMPLLGSLREDQKAVVRRHAQSLGLGSVASFI